MANVIKAAKWMEQGKQVIYDDLIFPIYMPKDGTIKMLLPPGPRNYSLDVADLLATTWRIAQ